MAQWRKLGGFVELLPEDSATMQVLDNDTKQCPQCRVLVSRTTVCDHMVCATTVGCGCKFWYDVSVVCNMGTSSQLLLARLYCSWNCLGECKG